MSTSLGPIQNHTIFVSHSSKDNSFGLKLVQDLRQAIGDENAVWYDAKGGLHGGDAWWDKIKEELRARSVFLVVLSPDSLVSPWVQDEMRIAWKQKNSQGKQIIPVLYRQCDVPDDLDTLHVISFIEPRVYEDALNELLEALRMIGFPVGMEGAFAARADNPDEKLVQQVTPQIEQAFARKNMAEVIQKADFLIKKVPGAVSSSIYRMQGLAYLEEGDLPHADESLNAALALVSDRDTRQTLLREHTEVLSKLGKWDQVLRHISEAVRMVPNDPYWQDLRSNTLDRFAASGQTPSSIPGLTEQLRPFVPVPVSMAGSIYKGHTASVYGITWSPDSRYIASSSADHTIQIWEAESGRQFFTYKGHTERVNAVAWSPDGGRIASASNDKTIRVIEVASGRELLVLRGHTDWIQDIEWSNDSQFLVSASKDKTVQIWETSTGKNLFVYRGHTGSVNAAMWSPDGERIASASSDKTAHIWIARRPSSAALGDTIVTYKGHTKGVNALIWSPGGAGMASASDDKTVHEWDPRTGEPGVIFHDHTNPVLTLARSPHGRRIASASDKLIHVWFAATGANISTNNSHIDWVRVIAWSPNGRHIASGGDDKTVRVWSVVEESQFSR